MTYLVVSLIGPEAGGNSLYQNFCLDSLVGLGQILSYDRLHALMGRDMGILTFSPKKHTYG